MTTATIIPLNVVPPDSPEAIDELTARLERSGFMAVMQIGEPRLSELAAKYKAKGYEVELVPLVEEGMDSGGGGCGTASSCNSANSSGGCGSGGGCGSTAATPQSLPQARRRVVRDISLIYVRMPS